MEIVDFLNIKTSKIDTKNNDESFFFLKKYETFKNKHYTIFEVTLYFYNANAYTLCAPNATIF